MAIEDTKFSHQAYLSSYIDEISSELKKTRITDFEYINLIDTEKLSLAESFALLTGKSENLSFTKLKSHQYSALIPKIRIYRVDTSDEGDREYEFVFDKTNKLNYNILGENIIRDNSAGIKNINWTLAGTNPISAERNIECSIDFYFNSINAFSGGDYDSMLSFWKQENPVFSKSVFDNQKTFTTRNYWALLFHPDFKRDSSAYESVNFRIKVVIGWEDIEPNIKRELFSDPVFKDLDEEIKNSNIVMYLNLVKHNFEFKEDGSVVVKAEYIGTLENALFNYKYDLFRGLKEKLNRLNNSFTYSKFIGSGTINLNKEKLKLSIIKSIINGDDSYGLSNCGDEGKSLLGFKNSLKDLPPDIIEKRLLQKQEYLDEIEKEIIEKQVLIKNEFYNSLIQKLMETNKLYSLEVNESKITNWLAWKNESEAKTKASSEEEVSIPKPPLLDNLTITELQTTPANVQSSLEELTEATNPTSSAAENAKRLIGLGSTNDEFINNKLDEITNKIKESEAEADKQTIYYTTVGNLIEAASNIIVTPPQTTPLDQKDITEFKRNIITFSTFNEFGTSNIADIPIAYNNLLQFFIDKVYKPQKNEYSLYQFIKDVVTTLIEPALNNRSVANGEINKYSNVSLATNIITLKSQQDIPNTPPLNNITLPSNIDLSDVTRKDLKPFYPTSTNQGGRYYFYYFIYDKYSKEFNGKGDPIEDSKRGIYHYTIAQDVGLIKSINFKRNDQPYLRESKSVGKKTIFLGQFRDIYAADVKMVGNNIYTPGMILLLKPSVEFGKVIGTPENPSFSQVTGVGGYYTVIKVSNTIDENGYSTDLECLFHSNEPKTQRRKEDEPCERLIKFYGTDAFLNEIQTELNSIASAATAESGSLVYQAKQEVAEQWNSLSEGQQTGVVGTVAAGLVFGIPGAIIGGGATAIFADSKEQEGGTE
jgi:hypothetical protein